MFQVKKNRERIKEKKTKKTINLLFDPDTENSKHIFSYYMCNMKESRNIYTDAHRHKVILQVKGTHRNHFQGVKSLAGIIEVSMTALHMKYEGKD